MDVSREGGGRRGGGGGVASVADEAFCLTAFIFCHKRCCMYLIFLSRSIVVRWLHLLIAPVWMGCGGVMGMKKNSAAATIGAGTATATCPDSETASCTVQRWDLRPENNTVYASYLAYDDAIHPALISEVWFRYVFRSRRC